MLLPKALSLTASDRVGFAVGDEVKILRQKHSIGLLQATRLISRHGTACKALAELAKECEKRAGRVTEETFSSLDVWPEFSPEYCKTIREEHREHLKPFTCTYSGQLWSQYVSATHRHLMLVDSDESWKITKVRELPYNWSKDWEENRYEGFREQVQDALGWQPEDTLYSFWSQSRGLQTQWAVFCEYWIAFLYDDECTILVNPKSRNVLILSVHGRVQCGERKKIAQER